MITVIAGVNGAGKSSVLGAFLRSRDGAYFNPDEAARDLMRSQPGLTQEEANGQAWLMGVMQLDRAIEQNDDYILETTLGGNTIYQKLRAAMENGVSVRLVFCGLASEALHIERVRARVLRGGHDIPEAKIRQRWQQSRYHLCQLIPYCDALVVYDNSHPLNDKGQPQPQRLLVLQQGQFLQPPPNPVPEWAKPIVMAALKRAEGLRSTAEIAN